MKKRELEDWEMAECIALKKAVDAFNSGKPRKSRVSQEALAAALGINQGSVSSYLNGVNALNAKVAAVIAGKIGIQVEDFSPRLAREITEMAMAIGRADGRSAAEKPGSYHVGQLAELMGLATPRSRAVLQRINQAAIDGRLSEADLDLLDQIATRFESRGQQPAAGGEGSHKRLRDKLQNDDPHPQK